MKDVGKVPLDNPVYRFCRKFVLRLDNAMFNHNGSEGKDYQPTRFALVLPYLGGIAAASYFFFSSFGKHDNNVLTNNILTWVPILILVNVVLTCRNIFVLHGWVKRVFYPVFIAAATLIFFFVVTFVCAWIYAIVMVILILWLCLSAWLGSEREQAAQASRTPVREEVIVDDGSFWGKTLTRTGGVGDWQDRSGNSYEEFCGEFKKK